MNEATGLLAAFSSTAAVKRTRKNQLNPESKPHVRVEGADRNYGRETEA